MDNENLKEDVDKENANLLGLLAQNKAFHPTNNPTAKTLDPNLIQTTILAEVFEGAEEEAELNKAMAKDEKLAKFHHYMMNMRPVRNVCLIFVWLSLIDQKEPWCKQGHKDGKFDPSVYNCNVDTNGLHYFTYPKL